MKQVYKITYPTGKIYVGKDRVGSARYMGSPDMDLVNADFETLPDETRRDYTLRKQILWESATATEAELSAKEVEMIRKYRSNDPAIGFNRWPRLRTDGTAPARRNRNRWGIPAWLEREVRERDTQCVYCGIAMLDSPSADGSRGAVGTWEHIINDASIVTRENIARCCASCNSSKGARDVSEWLGSSYCGKKKITADSVAEVVKEALLSQS
jgi:hypothetical protein